MRLYLLWDVQANGRQLKAVCYDFIQVERIINLFQLPLRVESIFTDSILTDDSFKVVSIEEGAQVKTLNKTESQVHTSLTLNDIMPFGKHRGKKLKELPFSYLRWLVDTVTLYVFGSDVYSYLLGYEADSVFEPTNHRRKNFDYVDADEDVWRGRRDNDCHIDDSVSVQTIRDICTNAPREAMDMIWECDRRGEDVPDDLRAYTRLMVAECD